SCRRWIWATRTKEEGDVSVLMVLPVKVDPAAFAKVASEHADAMQEISGRGKAAGAVRHAFFAGDGEGLAVDEWPDAQSFLSFFEAEGPNIGPLMAAASAEPGEPRFYERLDTADVF